MTPLFAGPLTVVVADDDDDMRAYLARTLLLVGATRVLAAADGRRALDLAGDADLVVSDQVLPGLDGEALCRAVHARHPGVPVLLVSGLPPAAGSEADGYLAKPFNGAALHAAVARLCPHPRRAPPA